LIPQATSAIARYLFLRDFRHQNDEFANWENNYKTLKPRIRV